MFDVAAQFSTNNNYQVLETDPLKKLSKYETYSVDPFSNYLELKFMYNTVYLLRTNPFGQPGKMLMIELIALSFTTCSLLERISQC